MQQDTTVQGYYSIFFIMFGRYPRLAVDAFLGIRQTTDTSRNHNDYVDRLKQHKRLDAVMKYHLQSSRNVTKRQTDKKDIMKLKLDVEDYVLIKKKGCIGDTKLVMFGNIVSVFLKESPSLTSLCIV